MTCEQFKQSLPDGWISRTVQVPLDWSRKGNESLQVFYYGNIPKTGLKRIVAYVHGGVAGNSWGIHKSLEKLSERPGTGFILFDRRGRGCSGDLPIIAPPWSAT